MVYSPPPGFDFNAAAAQARAEYPDETLNITFVQGNSAYAIITQTAEWLSEASTGFIALHGGPAERKPPAFHEPAARQMFYSSSAFTLYDPEGGKGLLAFLTDAKRYPDLLGAKNLAYAFQHELAHLVAEGGATKTVSVLAAAIDAHRNAPEKEILMMQQMEIVADCLGALNSLRLGLITPDDVETVAARRAARAEKDPAHDTSAALRALMQALDENKISALTPQSAKKMAEAHAAKFAPRL